MSAPGKVHLSETVACLALATDLGMGQPLEHGLRTCLLAVRVGEALGLSQAEIADAYYICLLRFVGCNAHAHQDALETGDEIAFRSGIAPFLNGGTPEILRFMVGNLGRGAPVMHRARMVAGALAAGPKGGREPIATTCEVARMIASRLDMSPGVVRGLDYTYEHHDGSGFPNGAAAEEIPVAAHVAMVARDFEILYRLGGWDMVLEVAKKRRGRAYNPRVLDGFVAHALGQLEAEASETGWDAVMAADPSPVVLSGTRLMEALTCCADFADISSPFTLGYSHQVSDLAARAAGALRLDSGRIELVRCAALVQELGMSAVSRAVVDKAGPLTDGEWERVRLHPYFTERILVRCPGLAPIGTLAGSHHERMDGSGYHRGTAADRLPPTARLLAAAGAYVAITSGRPWRPAIPAGEAATTLGELVSSGAFEGEAVDAVLAAAGEPASPRRRRARPAGLTEREVEVLRLISRGMSNRQVAGDLMISVKTVGRHVENIYTKAGVSTRAAAAMFALQNGLAEPEPFAGQEQD